MAEGQAVKTCSFCGEEILAVAIKCKHCGSVLDGTAAAAATEPPCKQCGGLLEAVQQCPRCKAIRTATDAAGLQLAAPCRQDGTPLIDVFQCPKCKALRIPPRHASVIAVVETAKNATDRKTTANVVKGVVGGIVVIWIIAKVVGAAMDAGSNTHRESASTVAIPSQPSAPATPTIAPPPISREAKEFFEYAKTAEAKKDIRGAVEMYDKSCTAGEIAGCAMAGYWYAEGKKSMPRNYSKAVELDTKGCDGDIGMACNNLAVLYTTGKGVEKDWSKAGVLLEKGCKLGFQAACNGAKVAKWNVAADASALWRAYHANEVAADQRFKGRQLTVSGFLQSVDKDFTDDIILRLRSPNQFMSTRAYLNASESGTAARLRKGSKILLSCTCEGMLVGSPVLKNCTIEDTQEVRYDDDDE